MTSIGVIGYDYSDIDESSFVESINHPSFVKAQDSSSISYLSSPNTSLVRSANKSSQVTGIRHPSIIHDEQQHPTTNSADAASSGWSFQYNDFEQELLQDTSPPHSVSGNILSSPKPTSSIQDQPGAKKATTPPLLDKDTSAFLFDDDYSSATRAQIERSFNEQFGLQSSSSPNHRLSINSQNTSQISQPQHMTDMMESKCLQMQESLSSRLQMLEDKLKKTHLESEDDEQRSGSMLSRESNKSSISNGNDNRSQSDTNATRNSQQQHGGDIDQTQRILDLQHFVDRVDALVWNTPFLSPAETIKSAHVCERHRAWSEQILRERQKTALESLNPHDRMEATLQQLMQWSDSIRRNHHG
ncbi:hypothetical protein BCR42DRAFT_492111 [Absidia repens]|uniref:Uncharacterized protein n=1 Tax=Absidia repens TaxID=90262 RepID=A0A1X2IG53_9FUNG|nr:hypothetical protein BCR42DRAFT_492111 [Absidia repens]